MAKIPSLNGAHIVRVLERLGFVRVRQRGSHVRLKKRVEDELLKITVPMHRPVKRSTLSHILKQAHVSLAEFLEAM